jgi:DNA polymerase alpha-associated DNA helicase A
VCPFCLAHNSYLNNPVAEFPSKVMYGSRLKSHESVKSRLLRDLPNIVSTDRVEADKEILETPVVFFDTAGCEFFERADNGSDEGSRSNENEAEVVRRWVNDLVRDSRSYGTFQLIVTGRWRPAYFPHRSQ